MVRIRHPVMVIPLFVTEVAYSIVQQALADPDSTLAWELDPVLEPIWDQDSFTNTYYLDLVFPSAEETLEALTGPDRP
jgi:hypothetical protein